MGSRSSVTPSQEGAEAPDCVDRLQARPHLTGDERFPRSRRLVRGTDVRRVVTTGRRSRRDHLDILWATGETDHPRLGLIVPRFRQTAVARNRLRRRLKELWRREVQARLPAWDVVFRTRQESYRASLGELRQEILTWCETVPR